MPVNATSNQHLVGVDVQSALTQCFMFTCTLEVKVFCQLHLRVLPYNHGFHSTLINSLSVSCQYNVQSVLSLTEYDCGHTSLVCL